MNTAVISSFAYNNGPSEGSSQDVSAFATGAVARMAKRRRLDSSDSTGDYVSQGGWEQQPQSSHAYAPNLISNSQPPFASSNASGPEYAGGAATSHEASGASALNESSDPPPHHWQGADASPYPDVASYSQQPYFFQQTDPSAYNSPWPPAAETGAFGSQSSNYSVPAPVTTVGMPFFPVQAPSRTTDTPYGANPTASSMSSYPQDIDASAAYAPPNQWHQRGEMSNQPSQFYFDDASMHLKNQSLPILDNLATQLIHTIAKASYPQIQEIMRGNDTEDSQAYTTLKNLFDQTRKVYSRETPFIDAIAIQMFQPNQQEIIRKANIATFISSILGAHDVSFYYLNEFFMETFVPLGHRLLKWQGAIYLDLKTQTYISALLNSDRSPEDMLDELFPPDLDAQILTRHPDAPSLSPSEQDFIDRSRARKSYLLVEDSTEEALRELPKKYQWQEFVREFANCISKNVDGIMNVPTRAQPVFGSGSGDRRSGNAVQALQDSINRNNSGGMGGSGNASAMQGVQALSLGGQSGSLGGGSSRDANDGSKKAGASASTIRQPWTKPEEDALLSGLERVNGPHWSQILALYGRGGSISEVLKDRNQVQLKDKARNLKLWYLKMGKDVPPALRGVTGELRKRGGARARAALGITGDDGGEDENMDADGEAEGSAVDPALERSQAKGRGSKKKTKKGS